MTLGFVVALFVSTALKYEMRTALIHVAITGGALTALVPGSMNLYAVMQETARVELGKPAIVPVAGAERSELGQPAGRRLVITVENFEASPGAPVVGVVTAECHGVQREVGRFGPFPNRSIVGGGRVKPQRFGFDLPNDPSCRPLRSVTIALEPQTETSAAARMTVMSAEIE
jgi:hypothetical protein